MKTKDTTPKEASHVHKYGAECGVSHSDCPNAWQGTCDREAGHSGSHHCSACNMAF